MENAFESTLRAGSAHFASPHFSHNPKRDEPWSLGAEGGSVVACQTRLPCLHTFESSLSSDSAKRKRSLSFLELLTKQTTMEFIAHINLSIVRSFSNPSCTLKKSLSTASSRMRNARSLMGEFVS